MELSSKYNGSTGNNSVKPLRGNSQMGSQRPILEEKLGFKTKEPYFPSRIRSSLDVNSTDSSLVDILNFDSTVLEESLFTVSAMSSVQPLPLCATSKACIMSITTWKYVRFALLWIIALEIGLDFVSGYCRLSETECAVNQTLQVARGFETWSRCGEDSTQWRWENRVHSYATWLCKLRSIKQ